jgi:4-hydroxy-2-oxoheptanedioate aldolase
MLTNPAKQRLLRGSIIGGYGMTIPSSIVAQAISASGADFLTLDMEHGAIDVSAVHGAIASTAGTRCVPMVRVPHAAAPISKPVLDAGALGIVWPMIRSKEELEEGVASVLYPPAGRRGIGHHFAPARWGVSGATYLASANDALLKIALIETEEATSNIPKILAARGLDVAVIARGDLAANLGHSNDPTHPEVCKAIAFLEEEISKSPVALGGLALSAHEARAKIAKGYRFVVLGFDITLLQGALESMTQAIQPEVSLT